MHKAKLIERARQQMDSARILVEAIPEMLPELSKIEQEHLVMALIPRIDIRGNNQVKITLRLAPDVVHSLPILRSGVSPPLESGPLDDSRME